MSSTNPLFSIEPLAPAQYSPTAEGGEDAVRKLTTQLIEDAFDIIASTDSWSKGKVFNAKHAPADGGPVHTRSKKSGMSGRPGKCSWHMRESIHPVAGTDITFDDFRNGLLLNHNTNEMDYIPALIDTKTIENIKDGTTSVILNSYQLPMVTANRDFLELMITVDLPPHAAPFSPAHRAVIAESQQQQPLELNTSLPTSASEAGGLRSFLVIQVPVNHPEAAEQKGYVRGAYASVEAVYEASGSTGSETHWKMATQSDARGSIPLFLSESSLPGQIVQDVPEFVHWARSHKSQDSEVQQA
ncbi:unnamed protein product [Tilletia controversa]|uniref:DUF3074 domain-containing protein n=3 Tax=Tilletia TaxID=13289 RepID=A0A8X7MXR2_9BASI|nr:hypothetical protein CF336_g3367 [Tilletia laevis]KAE8203863.1 hypothetical protein CF328_g1409 [Tilletia controversa]KAE8262060.1 hypothetical protein A4X03_0g2753 [Tilletia caries]KAE8204243.1 hypothetical protein CF335_g2726 [Tilletia laevis]KAE8253068.1 hypothetical protein A4X06_0g1725 [Tilletia controversa]